MPITLPVASALDISVFILVLLRMSGFIFFNPILGRENIPMMIKTGLCFTCALIITPTIKTSTVMTGNVVQLVVSCMWELIIGFLLGVVVNILFSVVQLAGEQIDVQMGITMATIYDPHSNMSMPLMGSLFNVIMVEAFFISDAHLALFSLISDSFSILPPGKIAIAPNAYNFVAKLLSDYFELGFRLAIPIIAVELICQIAMGMLMRAVPSINIFSVGMHVEVIVGLLLVLLSTAAIAGLCGRLSTYIVEKCAEFIKLLGVT